MVRGMKCDYKEQPEGVRVLAWWEDGYSNLTCDKGQRTREEHCINV